MRRLDGLLLSSALAVLAGAALPARAAGVPTTRLYNFSIPPNGVRPWAPLIQDAAGNLYGTTYTGDALGYGTVYELFADGHGGYGHERVLHAFDASQHDGHYPQQAVTLGADGNLYGTTPEGGSAIDAGVIYTLTRPTNPYMPWTETIIHRFTGGADGGTPYGALVIGPDGAFYGTTGFGGAYGSGTLFRLAETGGAWTETVLHSFGSGTDGAFPYSTPAFDKTGNVYLTTLNGGSYGQGTAVKLSPGERGWSETVLYSFGEGTDGQMPNRGVVLDEAGNLFGTTETDGGLGYGTVFELSPGANGGAWTETALYAFDFVHGGGPSYCLLVRDPTTGKLWGTTEVGGKPIGTTSYGLVFSLTPDPSSPTGFQYAKAHEFNGTDGSRPRAGLLRASDGTLFGTTIFGGRYNNGVVFSLKP